MDTVQTDAGFEPDIQTRVFDYLDDKLQTAGDVDALDALLANIHTQHGLLKQQLHHAQAHLDEVKQAAHDHHAALQLRAREFQHEQDDIDARLRVLTASDTSDEAVPRFEAVLDSLQRLDVAAAYVELLAEIDALRHGKR